MVCELFLNYKPSPVLARAGFSSGFSTGEGFASKLTWQQWFLAGCWEEGLSAPWMLTGGLRRSFCTALSVWQLTSRQPASSKAARACPWALQFYSLM